MALTGTVVAARGWSCLLLWMLVSVVSSKERIGGLRVDVNGRKLLSKLFLGGAVEGVQIGKLTVEQSNTGIETVGNKRLEA